MNAYEMKSPSNEAVGHDSKDCFPKTTLLREGMPNNHYSLTAQPFSFNGAYWKLLPYSSVLPILRVSRASTCSIVHSE